MSHLLPSLQPLERLILHRLQVHLSRQRQIRYNQLIRQSNHRLLILLLRYKLFLSSLISRLTPHLYRLNILYNHYRESNLSNMSREVFNRLDSFLQLCRLLSRQSAIIDHLLRLWHQNSHQ